MSRSVAGLLRRWDPERVGPYAIIGRLGAGAMGQVYLARSTAGRLVAVKTIRIELAEEPGFRARFAREVAAARRVSGVFTAAVVAADPEADLPWVATAYVPAPSLSTLVRDCGPLPVRAVRWLAAGCAEALESIHAAGLLHRDVKPSNVLVAPDGPRVIDFGVARAAERVQLTVTRGAAGTPAYMAPEQARDAAQASPASDVFSLGATVVFAATGHPPYQGATVMDILVRLATEPPDLDGLPAELAGLVGACLERVPRDRPTTAAILAGLGSFAADPAGVGHAYLPDSAMAMIADYQRAPAACEGAVATGDDEADEEIVGGETTGSGVAAGTGTSGSHTDLPGFDSAPGFGPVPGPGPAQGSGPSGGRRAGERVRAGRAQLLHIVRFPRGVWPGGPRGRPRAGTGPYPGGGARRAARVRPLAWAAWAAVTGALVGAGIVLGMTLHGSAAQASGNGHAPPGDAQVAGPPPQCAGAAPATTPQLCISQSSGEENTVFVIHGIGYVPGAVITVRMVGVGVSPDRPVVDQSGMFNYAIDQGHYFFRGTIPPGTYTVLVSALGERSLDATFTILPPGASLPPSSPPPGVP